MTFVKGKTGNPGGRPKQSKDEKDFKQACRDFSMKAFDILVNWANGKKNPQASIKAVEVILERGYGKPSQEVSIQGVGDIIVNVIRKEK